MSLGMESWWMLRMVGAGFFTITPVEVAILVAGVALVFSIRRWRGNVVRAQKGGVKKEEAPPANAKGVGSGTTGTGSALNMREVTAQVQALLADVEETARRAAAQIENRRVRLEQVIAEADERIRKLEGLTGKAGAAGIEKGGSPPTASGPSVAPPPSASGVPAAAGKGAVVSASREASQVLSRLRQERGAPPANEDPAYRPIYELADQGKSSREIGQALGRQPGEIELILALRGKQRV